TAEQKPRRPRLPAGGRAGLRPACRGPLAAGDRRRHADAADARLGSGRTMRRRLACCSLARSGPNRMLTTCREGAAVRMKLTAALMTLFAAIAVGGASAADFDHDSGPCFETPGEKLLGSCPTGHVGEKYEIQIKSEEGSGCEPYDYFEIHNSVLPPGLSLARDGTISGVPTGTGSWRFWLWDRDQTFAQGGPSWCQFEDKSEREFRITIDPGLAIVNVSLEPATVGQPYTETLTAQQLTSLNPPSGSNVQATWSLASGVLPPGLTLSAAGALSGTPTTQGSWGVEITAQNGGQSATETFAISPRRLLNIAPSKPLATPPRPSVWEVGVPFSAKLTPSGGSGTYTFALGAGSLPSGLALGLA